MFKKNCLENIDAVKANYLLSLMLIHVAADQDLSKMSGRILEMDGPGGLVEESISIAIPPQPGPLSLTSPQVKPFFVAAAKRSFLIDLIAIVSGFFGAHEMDAEWLEHPLGSFCSVIRSTVCAGSQVVVWPDSLSRIGINEVSWGRFHLKNGDHVDLSIYESDCIHLWRDLKAIISTSPLP